MNTQRLCLKRECHLEGCSRKAILGWTMCPAHRSAGMAWKQYKQIHGLR